MDLIYQNYRKNSIYFDYLDDSRRKWLRGMTIGVEYQGKV
jgi:hypothetical protein